MSSLLLSRGCFLPPPSLFTLHYSLISCLRAVDFSLETEVGLEDTCADVEARIAKKHGLLGPFEDRDVNILCKEDQGSHLVRDIFPKSSSSHLGHCPDDKPMEAKAAVGTEENDYAIDNNIVEDEGDQDNEISYYKQAVGRTVAIRAKISGNKVSGKGKQSNHIGGPKNPAPHL